VATRAAARTGPRRDHDVAWSLSVATRTTS
jgi:hypothetical protein